MVLLQHKLSVKLSQRQILTPGLVQMVSVLALNKLELKDMINAEMVENPVLEELEESVPLIDEVGRKEEDRDRPTKTSTEETPIVAEKKDPFEEIDFGSFFQDYLDPGYRTRGEMEEIERPSFENFLAKPQTLTDHLEWQLGLSTVDERIRLGLKPREVSIGDFVCNGGEVPAMVVIDTVIRYVPRVLGDAESVTEESHSAPGRLEYPQYTRPPEFRGWTIPDILLSGHHEQIARWRRKESLRLTRERRPDLFAKLDLTSKLDMQLLKVLEEEEKLD